MARWALAFPLVCGLGLTIESCSISEGTGSAKGSLNVPNCWSGNYDLDPDFFTAAPYREESLVLRIQHGGDYQAFSDGLSILVDDVRAVREKMLSQPLSVDLPPTVIPLGLPKIPDKTPAIVSAALYLQATCRTQNVALYAVDRALLDEQGECYGDAPPRCDARDGGSDPQTDGGTTPSPTERIGQSTITFDRVSNAVIDEADASDRLIEGKFDLYFVDPRQVCVGGGGSPPRCRGHLKGDFRFYFQRGRPAQAFP